jgi:hypothetical protein
VDEVGYSALDRFRQDFLELLGDNRVFAVVQGVGPVSGLVVGVCTSGMDLRGESAKHKSEGK